MRLDVQIDKRPDIHYSYYIFRNVCRDEIKCCCEFTAC